MKPLRVFIVDDDKDFAQGLAMLLQIEGYDVTLAYSGEEAVEVFKHQDFDLTFMDVKLPNMSGVESFFEIRKLKPDAKIMMMTAFSVEQLLTEAIDGGALGVLNKPLDHEKVLSVLESSKPSGIILVADDDPDFVQSLKIYLSQANYRVMVAYTGQDAVDRVVANGIDILILDLRLPVLSGLEVYLELKRRQCTLPTIIVTGYANEEVDSIDKLKDLSVAGCMVKPFVPEAMLAAIDSLMENRNEQIINQPKDKTPWHTRA